MRAMLVVSVLALAGWSAGAAPLCELEAILSKNRLVIPYYNTSDSFTVAFLNFPTKLTLCADDADADDAPGAPTCDEWYAQGPYFQNFAKDRPTYGVDMYDMKEHMKTLEKCLRSPCPKDKTNALPDEVNVIADWLGTNNPFSEGWARVTLDTPEIIGCYEGYVGYNDAPVLCLIAEITPEGLSLMQPAYDFGRIYLEEATDADSSGCFQLCNDFM